jgi:hypothetical protein
MYFPMAIISGDVEFARLDRLCKILLPKIGKANNTPIIRVKIVHDNTIIPNVINLRKGGLSCKKGFFFIDSKNLECKSDNI